MSTADLTSGAPCPSSSAWPTTRILFALAGTVTLLSATLATTVTPWFLLLTAFVGLNQLVFVAAGACPASLVIDRLRRDRALSLHPACWTQTTSRSPDAARP